MDNKANIKQPETAVEQDIITISLPNNLTGEEEERLRAIVDSKRSLLTKALETEELPILVTADTISFPWFTNHFIEGEAQAYAQLVTALIKMAKEQKRVIARDKKEENEKFAMRIFTVRLGLKGDEYKLLRKLLAHNLTGNSSWKNGKPEKKAEQVPAEIPATEEQAEKPEKGPEKPNKAAKSPKKKGGGKAAKEANVVESASVKKEENTNE